MFMQSILGYKKRLSLICAMLASIGLAACADARGPAQDQIATVTTVTTVLPATPPQTDLVIPADARQAVQDAYAAMNKGRWAELDNLLELADRDPLLGQYPRYWALRKKVLDRTQPVPEAQVKAFLNNAKDGYLADKVRADWVLAATRAGDYAKVLQIPAVIAQNDAVRCSLLLARHQASAPAAASEVLAAFKPNQDCWSMLDQVVADGVLSRAELVGLLRASLETGKQAQADRMAGVVFDDQAVVQYAALMKNPRKWLDAHPQPKHAVDFELTAIALARLARGQERAQAANYVDRHWAKKIPAADLQWVWGQFGLLAALNVEPDAHAWYRQSGDMPKTDFNHAWEVRAELRAAPIDWRQVARAIEKMSPRQADEPVWRYWYGRALLAQGETELAHNHFAAIADDQSFYGLLAIEELGQVPSLPPQPEALDPAWLAQARANPGLQRAVALFDQGWRREAVPEWNFALRGMDDNQLRAAAEFAREQHIYDRVVNTSLLTKDVADFSQRFIAPFEGRVSAKAQEIDLDPAWVYGLIRQESRFITDARSRVGASGLMQLMPATAKWVAKKIGLQGFKPSQVNDFDTNTVLGTSYMNMVLRDLDGSQMLATAGYNAGPGRPKRWRASLPSRVEGAIFAETIPFTETRLYVKNVLSNTAYYSMLFTGQPQSLKSLLGSVGPQPGATTVALP